ncbi:MAG: hypothetical protein LBJ00_05460 [Planctomycetaceae bacterium]|nr:hypothetical protein [Planctomycetaceae bacterium]
MKRLFKGEAYRLTGYGIAKKNNICENPLNLRTLRASNFHTLNLTHQY